MSRPCSLVTVLVLLLSASLSFAGGPVPNVPIYIRTDSGWKLLYAAEDEYAVCAVKGYGVKPQDAYHVLLKPSIMLGLTFAGRNQIRAGNDLLGDHLQWELEYWRKHANRVEGVPRDDLSEGRDDLRVTEIRLFNGKGGQLKVYLIALAAKNGVFAMSISPADSSLDAQVKEIAASFQLVHRTLEPDEVKRLSLEERARQ